MFSCCVHIVATGTDGDPLGIWKLLGKCAGFHRRMHGDGGDFFTIERFNIREDSFYKRRIAVCEPDRSFMTEIEMNSW